MNQYIWRQMGHFSTPQFTSFRLCVGDYHPFFMYFRSLLFYLNYHFQFTIDMALGIQYVVLSYKKNHLILQSGHIRCSTLAYICNHLLAFNRKGMLPQVKKANSIGQDNKWDRLKEILFHLCYHVLILMHHHYFN